MLDFLEWSLTPRDLSIRAATEAMTGRIGDGLPVKTNLTVDLTDHWCFVSRMRRETHEPRRSYRLRR